MDSKQEQPRAETITTTESQLTDMRDNLLASFKQLTPPDHEQMYRRDGDEYVRAPLADSEVNGVRTEIYADRKGVTSIAEQQVENTQPLYEYEYTETGKVGRTEISYTETLTLDYTGTTMILQIDMGTTLGVETLTIDFQNKTIRFDVHHFIAGRTERTLTFGEFDEREQNPREGFNDDEKAARVLTNVHYIMMIGALSDVIWHVHEMADDKNTVD